MHAIPGEAIYPLTQVSRRVLCHVQLLRNEVRSSHLSRKLLYKFSNPCNILIAVASFSLHKRNVVFLKLYKEV